MSSQLEDSLLFVRFFWMESRGDHYHGRGSPFSIYSTAEMHFIFRLGRSHFQEGRLCGIEEQRNEQEEKGEHMRRVVG